MTRAYIRRYIKLLPRRIFRIVRNPTVSLTALLVTVSFLSTTTGRLRFPATPIDVIAAYSSSPLPTIAPTPILLPEVTISTLPKLSAKNVLVLDLKSDFVIYQKDSDSEIYPASTTKLMTAIVTLDAYSLDHVITVANSFSDGQTIGLAPGEKITVEKLLYALLVPSANDAGEVLAASYCYQDICGRQAFIDAMNKKAQELGLTHTQFLNPTGLDEEGHYSSASDLAIVAKEVLKSSLLRRIMSTQNAVISSTNDSQFHVLSTTNQLLAEMPDVLGMKTGFTDKAGQSLITYIDRNNHPLLIIVLGSLDRFTDSKNLINWAYSSVTWPLQTP